MRLKLVLPKNFHLRFKSMFRKKDIIGCICIAVIMIVLYSLQPEIDELMKDADNKKVVEGIIGFFDGHTMINFLVACSFIVLFSWEGQRIWKDNDCRLYRPLLILLCAEIIYLEGSLKYINISCGITYGILLYLLLFALGTVDVYKTCNKIFSRGMESAQAQGFSTDDIDINITSKNLQDYAKSITTQLLNTDISKHSFALGITGEWGGGKTTFMELLASLMKDRAEVVWFNPWMCRSPEQVADDFFVTLHKKLSPKYSSLSRPIRDYAQYISNATFSLGGGFLSKLTLALPRESLKQKKDRLSDGLSLLDIPVVVFIDDLDRLEMDEVFEVLRLIRNTADLKNVIYVVAFDKDYVTNVLMEKKIENAAAYLEKIFPVDIHQPKVDDRQLQKVLWDELSREAKYGKKFANKLFSFFNQNEMKLVLDILDNFRRVKRFARRYVLIVDYLIEAGIKDIRLTDLFWIELLQGYDKQTYDQLMHDPLALLYEKNDCYILRPNILKNQYVLEDDKKNEYKGEDTWKPKTPFILNNLFNNHNSKKRLGIYYIENFDKYFILGVSELKISLKEFNKLFENSSEPIDIINGWQGKYYSSIMFQFKHKDTSTLDFDGLWRYMTGLMYLAYLSIIHDSGVEYKAKNLINKGKYSNERGGTARGCLLAWFSNMIDNENTNYIALGRLLNRLYQPDYYDERSDKKSSPDRLLLSNNDLVSLLKALMAKYLIRHTDLTAIDVLNENSDFGKVFSNCSVCTLESDITDYCTFENVGFPVVVKWFAGKREKPSIDDYDGAISKMFYEGEYSYDEDSDYYDYMMEQRNMKFNSYFGSDDWLNIFKNQCFEA